jgi:hypothetical protein
MAQLHLYLPDDVATEVKHRAQARGMTVSAYLAEIVRSQMKDQWPKDFFSKVVGGWAGELERPEQPVLETREDVDVPDGHQRVHPRSQ